MLFPFIKDNDMTITCALFILKVVVVNITTLAITIRQYCVILDFVGKDGKPQLGKKKLVKSEKSFFLQPNEDWRGNSKCICAW